jgi:DNA-binding NtrC family response regulator
MCASCATPPTGSRSASIWTLCAPDAEAASNLAEQVAAHEKNLIAGAIAAHGGNLQRMRRWGSRKSLYEKMRMDRVRTFRRLVKV